MEEQVLFKQIKSLIEKEFNEIKVENDKLKKEIQELKGTLAKNIQMDKVDLGHLSQNDIKVKKQTTDYKLIDLGLSSGTLWMDRNIGAKSPTDSGLYFAWGETQGYTADEVGKAKQFRWSDYKYCNGDEDDTLLTKYCYDSVYGDLGYADGLITLQTTDDAAYQFTNGECHIPTKAQIQELIDNTTYKWTTKDGVKGGLFTSKINGNSIFIPASGGCVSGFVNCVGNGSHLWSSSLCKDEPYDAYGLYFGSKEVVCDYYRYYGFSVRGVSIK